MRILHAIPSIDPRCGGPSNALFGWASAQAEQDSVSVLSTYKDPAEFVPAAGLEQAGVKLINVGPCSGTLRRHRDLARVADESVRSADIVHLHGVWHEVQHQAARAARQHNVPYVVTPHGMLTPWSLAQGLVKKKLYYWLRLRRDLRAAALIHFTTATELQMVRPLEIGVRSIVEPLGVDLSEFESLPEPGTFKTNHPEIAGRKIVMFLGRVRPGKGLNYLIPAFAAVASEDAMLVVVGPDELNHFEWCRNEAKRCGISDRILFTGMLQGRDRVAALSDAHVMVLASDHENFGVSVIESLAAGTPVIISDQVYLHDQISRADVGTVVPRDVNVLAKAIENSISGSGQEGASAKARQFVWSNFDWQVIAAHWRRHYEEIIMSHSRKQAV